MHIRKIRAKSIAVTNGRDNNCEIFSVWFTMHTQRELLTRKSVAHKCRQVLSSSLATTDVGRKLGGGLCPFEGRLGEAGSPSNTHLTQYGLGLGLPPYQVASWSIQPFGHNGHEPKIRGSVPLGGSWVPIQHNVAGDEAYLRAKFRLNPSNRLATIHQRRRQTAGQTGQRSDSIGRTVLQTVAQLDSKLNWLLRMHCRVTGSGELWPSESAITPRLLSTLMTRSRISNHGKFRTYRTPTGLYCQTPT